MDILVILLVVLAIVLALVEAFGVGFGRVRPGWIGVAAAFLAYLLSNLPGA
jgi:hypothetical protein